MTTHPNSSRGSDLTTPIHGHLQKSGYRLTAPRQLIVDILATTTRHLSAEELYLRVYKSYPHIGIATVYRTLELLVRMGTVMKFEFGEHKSRYELACDFGDRRHHHHIICTNCGKIINYTDFLPEESDILRKTRTALTKKYQFEIKQHMVQFYGVCRTCSPHG